MTLPGYTGEASLYRSASRYRSAAAVIDVRPHGRHISSQRVAEGSTVLPALDACWQSCFEPCARGCTPHGNLASCFNSCDRICNAQCAPCERTLATNPGCSPLFSGGPYLCSCPGTYLLKECSCGPGGAIQCGPCNVYPPE
jgi:hypothetical protein